MHNHSLCVSSPLTLRNSIRAGATLSLAVPLLIRAILLPVVFTNMRLQSKNFVISARTNHCGALTRNETGVVKREARANLRKTNFRAGTPPE
ncbi:hypothetical protein DAEQUDRAFT_482994 [Daedalea quercina L-15889]|uniref:Uncharacterized protein n=1 Tax=Daedalea quercina L-15889 TaxID=1314783 RepID=A0A165MUY2_9APHY|nr:hypothetical protein DAEQUDRAFT_482994 [Daedalea quercina L-15889]